MSFLQKLVRIESKTYSTDLTDSHHLGFDDSFFAMLFNSQQQTLQ